MWTCARVLHCNIHVCVARVYLPLRICIKGWKNSFWMDAGDEMHFDEWMVRGDMIAVTPQNI